MAMDVDSIGFWFYNNIKYPIWNFRSWLCDKGIPCEMCTRRMKEAEEQLGEIYDIVCDATDPEFKGLLDVAGHDPLAQIKRVIEA